MRTYLVLHDLAVPSDQTVDDGKRFKAEIIEGGEGNTVEMNEAEAAPLLERKIIAVPEADEPIRPLLEKAAAARQRSAEAHQTSAHAEADAEAIQVQARAEAAARVPERK